jgi:predicted TIM-barrel fold metal-dependent hydrolase
VSGIIDVHVHLAGLPTKENGCKLSRKMLNSPLSRLIAWTQGLPLDDPGAANRIYVENLERELLASESVEGAVLLAMDGVYDEQGELDENHTEFLISNDHLLKTVEGKKHFLPGVSINPMRKDALAELDRCAERGAALVKMLPNSMVFNPADKKLRPFWRRLGELGIPMLSHIGYEFSLIGHDQSVGDPDRLIPALEEGATVIAAHGCSHGIFFYEKHLPTMYDMIAKFPRFFVDLSALTLPNRFGALLKLARRPEVKSRFLFGTDYPLPCFSFPALAGGGFLHARRANNRFDRQHRVLEALGLAGGADFRDLLKTPR